MQIALFVSSFDVVRSGWLLNFLKDISATRIKKCNKIFPRFVFWVMYSLLLLKPCKKFLIKPMPMMAGKVVNIKLHFRRSQRVVQGSRNVCTCECRPGNVTNTIPIVS
ncbi:hypothetical protein HN51_066600 [Arachis hypogaea]